MVIGTLAMFPFAQLHLGDWPAFFPTYQTAMFGTCLMTAHLFYAHFKATGVLSLLHLSAAYFYTACILFMPLLSFQGIGPNAGRLLGDSQTTIWLWFFWHLAPVVSVFHVALSEYRSSTKTSSRNAAVRRTGLCFMAALSGTALVVFVFDDHLPVLDGEADYNLITTSRLAPGLELLLVSALLALWRASRFRNVLQVWLGVLVVALLCDTAMTMMGERSGTLGWYAGRMGALIGFSVLAVVYLHEITSSYLRSVAVAKELSHSNSALDSRLQASTQITEELIQADHRKDEFLITLVHELRNPLWPMRMAAELLSEGKTNPKLVEETSEMLRRQLKHMTSLVDDLMDVSRFSHGLAKLREEPVDLQRVVVQSLEQCMPLIKDRGHELELRISDEPLIILGDERRMVQVVTNLLNNAAKYTHPGGRIVLVLEEQGDEAVLTVADNGIGMSAELTMRAFELFSQSERSSDRSQGGLGIGLALVRSLVELHHGRVTAASEGLGLGSAFQVVLPRLKREGTSDAARGFSNRADEVSGQPFTFMVQAHVKQPIKPSKAVSFQRRAGPGSESSLPLGRR